MIKIENVEVCGWNAAIRGMRNPMNSWDKSDSVFVDSYGEGYNILGDLFNANFDVDPNTVDIGPNDHDLMMRLARAGTEHSKYRRMIVVYADITAPLFWWKEFDTHKVGTVANSCSTMHKIHAKPFTLEDFSCDGFEWLMNEMVNALEEWRQLFVEKGDKTYWRKMIQLLPSAYNQKRTVMMNYENLSAMYRQRRNHKLDEWHTFREWIEALPYAELITGGEADDD